MAGKILKKDYPSDYPQDSKSFYPGDYQTGPTVGRGYIPYSQPMSRSSDILAKQNIPTAKSPGNFKQNHRKTWPKTSVKITNLNDKDIIPITNKNFISPQAKPTERKPKTQSLMVIGTASGVSSIEINGLRVSVKNGKWTTNIPIQTPGKIFIKARAGGNYHQLSVYIVELLVSKPVENKIYTLRTNPPAMPTIVAEAKIAGHPDPQIATKVSFTWNLLVGGYYRTRTAGKRDQRWEKYETPIQSIPASGSGSWKIRFPELTGGWGKLTVTTVIPGMLGGSNLSSYPRWIDIQGRSRISDVKNYINTQAGADKNIVLKIIKRESSYYHYVKNFKIKPSLSAPPQDNRIPADWAAPLGLFRPLTGPPAGVGVGQIDPGQFPIMHWNWKNNLKTAIKRYKSRKKYATQWPSKEQKRLDSERKKAREYVNKKRATLSPPKPALTADDPPRVVVKNYTSKQLIRDAVRRYNTGAGYMNYRYDAHFILSEDKLNVKLINYASQVITKDQATWSKEDPGRWSKRKSIFKRRYWKKLNARSRPYVTNVLGEADS